MSLAERLWAHKREREQLEALRLALLIAYGCASAFAAAAREALR